MYSSCISRLACFHRVVLGVLRRDFYLLAVVRRVYSVRRHRDRDYRRNVDMVGTEVDSFLKWPLADLKRIRTRELQVSGLWDTNQYLSLRQRVRRALFFCLTAHARLGVCFGGMDVSRRGGRENAAECVVWKVLMVCEWF